MGANIIVFPEYSIAFRDLGIDPNRPAKQNEMIIEAANDTYRHFLSLRHDMRSLGFPDDIDSFGFAFEDHAICYRSFALDAYYRNHAGVHKSYLTNRDEAPPVSLIQLSQLSMKIVKLNLNPLFNTSGEGSKGEWSHSTSEVLSELLTMKDRVELLLEDNGVEATIDNVLKYWSLKSFTLSGLSYMSLRSFPDGKAKFQERAFSLLRFPIPLVDCLTALSYFGNPDYRTTGLFANSPEGIMALQGAPQSFKDYFFFGGMVDETSSYDF